MTYGNPLDPSEEPVASLPPPPRDLAEKPLTVKGLTAQVLGLPLNSRGPLLAQ